MLTNKTFLAPKKIIIYSRDGMKQWNMAKKFQGGRVRSFIGDDRRTTNLIDTKLGG